MLGSGKPNRIVAKFSLRIETVNMGPVGYPESPGVIAYRLIITYRLNFITPHVMISIFSYIIYSI